MPGAALNSVQLNLSNVVPFIVMKSMALHDRMKEKDAWDIYFCLLHHAGGADDLTEKFRRVLNDGLVMEGLRKIRSKFASSDAMGPTFVADFEEISDWDERARIKRDAFERVSDLL